VRTVGTKGNRDGIGAKVVVSGAGVPRQWRMVKSGSSYCSQSELPVTFGLGSAAGPVKVEVRWPSGTVDTVDARAGERITVREGEGRVTLPSPEASRPAGTQP